MSDLLIDTSVLVAAEAGDAELDALLPDPEAAVAIAAITLAELEVGAELARGRTRVRRLAFAEWARDELAIVPYDAATAHHHASLLAHCRRTGTMRGAHDLIIAATARATGRTIVTLDRRGFADLPRVRVA